MKERFQAIIFDLDGVLIDSEELHARAKRITLQKYAIPYPETIFDDFKGRPDMVFWQHVANKLAKDKFTAFELDANKRSEYFKLSNEILPVKGAFHFLESARNKFHLTALVSSATEPDFRVSDDKFKFRPFFDIILLGEDTEHHKPHPEPYMKVLEKLHVSGAESLVIEDSPNGVMSAKSAGCFVIGISTGFTLIELLNSGADRVAVSFEEIAGIIEELHPA